MGFQIVIMTSSTIENLSIGCLQLRNDHEHDHKDRHALSTKTELFAVLHFVDALPHFPYHESCYGNDAVTLSEEGRMR